jgi:UDP-glucuronate decarboxylase
LSLPEDDPVKRKPNIDLARQMLNNWEPIIKLEEGLKKTIEYFDQALKKK